MRKSVALIAAAALGVATITPALARHGYHAPGYHGYYPHHYYNKRRNNHGPAIVGGLLTLGVIAALANQNRNYEPRYDYRDGYYYPQYPQQYYNNGQQYGQQYGPQYRPQYDQYPQQYAYARPNGNIIRCESKNYDTRFCAVGYGGQVDLYRKLSSASCYQGRDQGRDWGLDRGGIWVANGCRAEFVVY